MNLLEAKKTIAAYLAGHPVASDSLQGACELIRSDPEYMMHLREELGWHADWIFECDVFRASVAEFSELSEKERLREMPELVLHLRDCERCREVYWKVRSWWLPEVVSAARARGKVIAQRLAEAIRLGIDQTGGLTEQGLHPPPVQHVPVAATAAAPRSAPAAAPQPQRKQWLLKDEDANCEIQFNVTNQRGQAALSCNMKGAPQPARIRIELINAENNSLVLSGRLSDFQAEPIFLAPGRWTVRIVSPSDALTRIWEIPLEIEKAGEARSTYEG